MTALFSLQEREGRIDSQERGNEPVSRLVVAISYVLNTTLH